MGTQGPPAQREVAGIFLAARSPCCPLGHTLVGQFGALAAGCSQENRHAVNLETRGAPVGPAPTGQRCPRSLDSESPPASFWLSLHVRSGEALWKGVREVNLGWTGPRHPLGHRCAHVYDRN